MPPPFPPRSMAVYDHNSHQHSTVTPPRRTTWGPKAAKTGGEDPRSYFIKNLKAQMTGGVLARVFQRKGVLAHSFFSFAPVLGGPRFGRGANHSVFLTID